VPAVLARFNDWEVSKVLVAGIESHVCVQQTALDLLANGFEVYVAADAVGSRRPADKRWALDRMAGSGVVVTTSEAAVFEWTQVAGTPEFKRISQWIKAADVRLRATQEGTTL
jgi:isochorismate hydrolase